MVQAYWTGAYPCLCEGHWQLIVNGADVSHLIPSRLYNAPMNTYGAYCVWYFNDYGSEYSEYYEDGLKEFDWIIANKDWLDVIVDGDVGIMHEIYNAIQQSDFRAGSCGGCI